MKYNKNIISPLIRTDERITIPTEGFGDSLFISLDPVYEKTLNHEAPESVSATRFPSVMLVEDHKNVISSVNSGEDISFKVALSNTYTSDITVDYSIEVATFPDPNIRETKIVGVTDTVDYSTFFTDVDTTLLDNLTGTITIPTGQAEVTHTIPTTANTVMFKGDGSFFCGKVVLSNLSEPQYMLHPELTESYFLLQDAIPYPKWGENSVEVWGRLPDVSYFQPIIDSSTDATVIFTFNYEKVDDGSGSTTLGDITLRSKIIDDVPLDAIQLRPVTGTTVVDVENETPVDLTGNLPYYKAKVVLGRRD